MGIFGNAFNIYSYGAGDWGRDVQEQTGLRRESLNAPPYESKNPYKNPPQFDSGGYTDRMPRGKWALDYQYLANRDTEQRRQALWGDAQNVLRQGADLMQSYRPGGSAALASNIYGQRASMYGTQAMNTQAPDLLIAWRERIRQEANAEREQANKFQRFMSVWNASSSNIPSINTPMGGVGGSQPSPVQSQQAQIQDVPQAPQSGVQGTGGGGSNSVAMPATAGGGGGGGTVMGSAPGGMSAAGAAGVYPATVQASPVQGSSAAGGGNGIVGGSQDGGSNAAHGYNTSSGMKGDKTGRGTIIGGGGGGGFGISDPGPMGTFSHGEAASRAMGSASPVARSGTYSNYADLPSRQVNTMLMQQSARDRMVQAMGYSSQLMAVM